MGNWNQKKLIPWIINKRSFLCGKCNTLVSLMAGVDFYYFGNGIGSDPRDYSIKKNEVFQNDGRGYIPLCTIENYFANDFIVWKCEKCYNININESLSHVPKSIIPISKEYFEIKEISKIPEIEENLTKLIEEFYKAKSLGFNSSATLLGRKILMHICVEQEIAKEGQKFIEYVDALKKSELIGMKWRSKVDPLRQLGNDEAHKIKIASDDELNLISSIIKNLLTNIYVD